MKKLTTIILIFSVSLVGCVTPRKASIKVNQHSCLNDFKGEFKATKFTSVNGIGRCILDK